VTSDNSQQQQQQQQQGGSIILAASGFVDKSRRCLCLAGCEQSSPFLWIGDCATTKWRNNAKLAARKDRVFVKLFSTGGKFVPPSSNELRSLPKCFYSTMMFSAVFSKRTTGQHAHH